MNLHDFNSVFEIFAVYNFVFFGVKKYGFTLNDKIYQSKEKISYILSSVESLFTILDEHINKVKNLKSKDSEFLEIVFKNNLNELKYNFRIKENRIFDSFEKFNSINGFSKICLFSALYCIVILFISGFINYLVNHVVLFKLIAAINLFILVTISIIAIHETFGEEKNFYIQSIHILFFLLIILIIAAIYYYVSIPISDLYLRPKIRNFAIFSSVLIPVFHFIIYTIRFFVVHHMLLKRAENTVAKTFEKVEEQKGLIRSIGNTLREVEDLKTNVIENSKKIFNVPKENRLWIINKYEEQKKARPTLSTQDLIELVKLEYKNYFGVDIPTFVIKILISSDSF